MTRVSRFLLGAGVATALFLGYSGLTAASEQAVGTWFCISEDGILESAMIIQDQEAFYAEVPITLQAVCRSADSIVTEDMVDRLTPIGAPFVTVNGIKMQAFFVTSEVGPDFYALVVNPHVVDALKNGPDT